MKGPGSRSILGWALAAAIASAVPGCAWFREPGGGTGGLTVTRVTPKPGPARPTPAPATAPSDSLRGSAPADTTGHLAAAPPDTAGAGEAAASSVPGAPPGASEKEAGEPAGGPTPPAAGNAPPRPPGPAPPPAAAGSDTTGGLHQELVTSGGRWTLDGKTLTGKTGPQGKIIVVDAPVITHGGLVIRAAQGEYAEDLSEARLRGGVTFREDSLRGSCDSATYDRTTRMLDGQGHVVVDNDTLRVTSDRGRYDRDHDRLTLIGNVVGTRGTRHMTSHEAEWDRGDNEVLLRGNVVVTQPDENTVLTGELIDYDVEHDRARVLETPRLELSSGEENPIEITGERLWVEPGGDATAAGDVEVVRGGVIANSDSAAFYRDRHWAHMLGNPEVTERDGVLTGDTLAIFFDQDQAIRRVEMHGAARVEFAPKDSARLGELSTVHGDSLTMYFSDAGAESVLVFGGAQSTYRPSPRDRSAGAGTNVVKGDSIMIFLDQGQVSRVRVRGKAKGVFTFVEGKEGKGGKPAPPADSLGTAEAHASPDTLVGPEQAKPGEDKVIYAAEEVFYNLNDHTVDLAHSVDMDYGTLNLTAGKVRFYADRRYLDAEDDPVLIDKEGGTERRVVGMQMDYDLDTREGTIERGRTKAEDGFIYADKLRQVEDDDFIARNGNFTTCDNVDHDKPPHFHFTSKRMRLYLKDKVVAKPVVLYIRNIPVFAIPFYVFSVRKGRQSGFLTPDFDFGLGGSTGRFFRNVGYYWAASQYWDLAVSTTYYEGTPGSPGRFIGGLKTQYAKRNLMKGTVNFERVLSSNSSSYDLVGAHEMSLGAWRVTANGEFRDASFRSALPLDTDFGTRVDRILKSDASLSRTLPIGSLYLKFSREEDLAAKANDGIDKTILTEQLPSYSFSVNPRTVGRAADAEGKGGRLPALANLRWTFSSSGNSTRTERERTTYAALDSATVDTNYAILSDRSTQARHNFSLSDSRKLFGVLNLSPSVRATEQWVDREFSAQDTVKGFRRAATWGASMSANTKLYGTFKGIGPVTALRHVFTPSASFTYQPAFNGLTYADSAGVRRPRFPGVSGSEARSVGLSMDNSFQAKVKSGEDEKRLDLFHWSVATGYDFVAADHGLRAWSPVSSTFDLSRIYGVSVNFTSSHDPYHQLRFQNYQFTGSFSLAGKLPGGSGGEATAASPSDEGLEETPWASLGADQSLGRNEGVGKERPEGEDLGWNSGFYFSYGGVRGLNERIETNAALNFRASVNLTKNWSVDYNNRWDLKAGKSLGENLGLHRKLHCWEAQFTRSRLGSETQFSFRINVLDLPDVKYEQGRTQGTDFGSITRVLP